MSVNIEKKLGSYRKTKAGRVFLGKADEQYQLPDLNENQLFSYSEFLQKDVEHKKRKDQGLQNLFLSNFPLVSNDEKIRLEFLGYRIEDPTSTVSECLETDKTYGGGLYGTFRVSIEDGEIKEQDIFVSQIPFMTPSGTFVINGAERVVVSQMHRSPGVVFDYNDRTNMYYSRVIPERGSWLEFEITREIFYVRIDRRMRASVISFLKAIGVGDDTDILRRFGKDEELSLRGLDVDDLVGNFLFEKVEVDGGESYKAGTKIDEGIARFLINKGFEKIKIFNRAEAKRCEVVLNSFAKDGYSSRAEVCSDIYHIIYGSAPTTDEIAIAELERMFFSEKSYTLGKVGRYKLNKKFDFPATKTKEQLDVDDVLATVKYLNDVYVGDISVDDIDHLGNRRIRLVGEQFYNHLKVAFSRVQKLAKEKMTIHSSAEQLTPQNLFSIKPIISGVKEFFGTSELSQFMDQTNPLSALTHKRRLSSLGPGGLVRERAGFEVRDVHYSHYGKICPIETPEGPNIGLIVSLASFAKINRYGFIEAPYFKVKDGRVTGEVEYLSAIEEDRVFITPFTDKLNKDGSFKDDIIVMRNRGNYYTDTIDKVSYMDVSSRQIISVSTSLIPFLEHDDANRALMGSNMQRQAVPLLRSESPIVGTGVEGDVARYSGFAVTAEESGDVVSVDNRKVVIEGKSGKKEYFLKKLRRTNQDNFYNQSPTVREGDKVEAGDMISTGPSVDNGELALGKNVFTAFMTWEGYNFEDAVLMSEDLLRDDTYTSVHIEEMDIECRETKLGRELITRDVPSISEEDAAKLDEDGIIMVGEKVKNGTVLVGKVTPKGHSEMTPEFKLLYSIFGEKAKDVKDSSLRFNQGSIGVVVGVKRYTRDNSDDLKPGIIEKIKVYIAKKKKLQEGDKFAGRHGNKGVVARILPVEDMPHLKDGRPVQVLLNPLGVPSRMNVGQVYELILGFVGHELGVKFSVPVFNNKGYEEIEELLKVAGIRDHSLQTLYDGRTGEPFHKEVTVGYMYYLKLAHLVDDKIHARSTGPYSLVTQQPLGGKAQFGGQRVGEMEVWAIEAYGAANILQEFLTIKADAMEGRSKIYEAIIKGEYVNAASIPESFNVLVQELRGLGLDIEIYDSENKDIFQNPDQRERDKNRKLI